MTSANDQTFKSSRIRTINRRSRLTNLVHIFNSVGRQNPHTIRKEQGTQFPVLWSIFVTYIITHHGLGGFSGLINGLIAAVNGNLSMLMSEPTAKSNVKRTSMFVLSITTLHYTVHIYYIQTKCILHMCRCCNPFNRYCICNVMPVILAFITVQSWHTHVHM